MYEPRGGLTMELQMSSLSDDGSVQANVRILQHADRNALLLKRKRKSMMEIWFPGIRAVSMHVAFPESY